MNVWKGWERFDQGWYLRLGLKHIDRYDPSNQGKSRIDVANEVKVRQKFPGVYRSIRKAYPDLGWSQIFDDMGYKSASVTADGYPILDRNQARPVRLGI